PLPGQVDGCNSRRMDAKCPPGSTRSYSGTARADPRMMNVHVRDCLITEYEGLIPALQLPDPDDRHVLAAAIGGGADLIVTFNLRHFPDDVLKQYGIEALHPDEFVSSQLDLAPNIVCAAAKRQRESLKNPPKTVDEYLESLERQGLPQTTARLRQFADLI